MKADSHLDWNTRSERGSALWLKFIVGLYRLLGAPILSVALWPIAAYFFLFGWSARCASLHYLQRIEPRLTGLRLYVRSFLHFHSFARSVADKFLAWRGDIPLCALHIINDTDLRAELSAGRGVVLIGSHLGNIEVLRALTTLHECMQITPFMFQDHSPLFASFIRATNARAYENIVTTSTISPELIIDLTDRIAHGESIGLLADRCTPGAPTKQLEVPFLGSPASFPTGPFILAGLLSAPVFLVFCFRTKTGAFEVHFERFADQIVAPRKDRTASLRAYLERYAQRLEAHCRNHPLQWFNFYDFWLG